MANFIFSSDYRFFGRTADIGRHFTIPRLRKKYEEMLRRSDSPLSRVALKKAIRKIKAAEADIPPALVKKSSAAQDISPYKKPPTKTHIVPIYKIISPERRIGKASIEQEIIEPAPKKKLQTAVIETPQDVIAPAAAVSAITSSQPEIEVEEPQKFNLGNIILVGALGAGAYLLLAG